MSTGTTRNPSGARATRGGSATARPRKRITPEQALAVTQELLAQKQQHDRETAPWQLLDGTQEGAAPRPGFQSGEAASKNLELHAAESRMKATQGSMSARDRRNQGKRDHRDD